MDSHCSTTPTDDGEVGHYQVDPTPQHQSPVIYFVNGIQTDGPTHAATALMLSAVTERTITGIYNATGGIGVLGGIIDGLQCVGDWTDNVESQIAEFTQAGINKTVNGFNDFYASFRGKSRPTRYDDAATFRKYVPYELRRLFVLLKLKGNKATTALFGNLIENIGHRQLIVCHSQGNLVAAGALWGIQTLLGPNAMNNLQVYSLASPNPAWPAGINYKIKLYGNSNDFVTWFNPKNLPFFGNMVGGRSPGDWRKKDVGALERHSVEVNVFDTNFANRIRSDLGLSPLTPDQVAQLRGQNYQSSGGGAVCAGGW